MLLVLPVTCQIVLNATRTNFHCAHDVVDNAFDDCKGCSDTLRDIMRQSPDLMRKNYYRRQEVDPEV